MKFFQRENAAGERPLIVRSGALFLALCLVMTLLGGTFGTVAEAAWSANTGTAAAKTIYLNDVGADGAVVETLPVQLTGDESVAQALADVQLGADGRAASDCVWYTLSAEGEKQPLAWDVQPDDGTQLFTYTYQLTVLVEPEATAEPQPDAADEAAAPENLNETTPTPAPTAQPTEAPENVGDLPAASPAESTPAPEAADAPQADAAVQAADAGAAVAEAESTAQPEETAAPTEAPTEAPTAAPTATVTPTAQPTQAPTAEPAASTAAPSPEPTAQPADPTAPPEADAAPAADESTPEEENPAQEPLTIMVTAREGTALDAASFEQDGVDYTTYAWTDAETGEAVDSAALLAAGLSADVAVYAVAIDTTKPIHLMVSDGTKWVEVAKFNGMFAPTGGVKRYYIYADELLKVLGQFGVTAANISSGKYIFPISDDQMSVWGDTPTATLNGKTVVQLNSAAKETWLYYAPKNLKGDGNIDAEEPTGVWTGTNSSGAKFDYALVLLSKKYGHGTFNQQLLDTFTQRNEVTGAESIPTQSANYYMIQAPEAGSFVPTYAKAGDQVTITLPAPKSGYTWVAADITTSSTTNMDGTINYTFTMPAAMVNFQQLVGGQVAVKGGISFMVLIDNQWTKVGDTLYIGDGLTKESEAQNIRVYLTGDTLEKYYGAYGFHASDLANANNKYLFGHATQSSDEVWYDQPAQQIDGVYAVPFMLNQANNSYGHAMRVYYLPGNAGKEKGKYNNVNAPSVLQDGAQGFYTVSINNDKGGLQDSNKASTSWTFRAGAGGECILPALKDGFKWQIVNKSTGAPLTSDAVEKKSDNTDGTTTYTIKNITCPVMFYAVAKTVQIDFWAVVNGEWQQVTRRTEVDGIFLTDSEHDNKNGKGDHEGCYYVTAETLESVYGKFGFTAQTLGNSANARIFPHRADKDTVSLWANVPVHTLADGTKVVLVTKSTSGNHLYYVPNNVDKLSDGTQNPYFSGRPYPEEMPNEYGVVHKNTLHEIPYSTVKGTDDSKAAAQTIISKNNFYGVIVEDPDNKLTGIDAATLSSYNQDARAKHTIKLPVAATQVPENYIWWVTYNGKTIALDKLGDAGNKEIANHIVKTGEQDTAGNQIYTVTLPVDDGNVGNIKFTLAQKSGAKVETMNVRTVYWVSIDGAWKRVADEKTVDGQFTMGPYAGRYFIKAQHLEEVVYKDYDFHVSDLDKSENAYLFPYRTSSQEQNVWAENPAQQIDIDGTPTWVIPLRSETDKTGDTHIYYMPGNTTTAEKPYGQLAGTGVGNETEIKNPTAICVGGTDTKMNHVLANAFYSVSVDNSVDGIRAGFKKPEKLILRAGDNTGTYTVPPLTNEDEPGGFKWIISDLEGKIIETTAGGVFENPTKNTNGSTTYYIKGGKDGVGIQHPIVFRVEYVDADTFAYNADTLDQDMLVKVSSLNIVNQKIKEHGTITIDGETAGVQKVKLSGFADASDDAEYTVRAPDQDALRVEAQEGDEGKADNHPRVIFYHFDGWRIGWSDTILHAGDTITKGKLKELNGKASQILRAQWTPFDAVYDIDTVNFYLSLNCEVRDHTGVGTTSHDKDLFTESLYAARVLKEPLAGSTSLWKASTSLDQDKDTEGNLLSGSYMFRSVPVTDKTGYSADTALRASTRTAMEGNKSQYKVKLSAFPSDEEIFAKLRDLSDDEYAAKKISIDGYPIEKQYLTPENFQIRWYTLKYHNSDGWHIDGVLVAKESRLVVTKTFSGDADAIQQVKDQGFSISVTHDETNQDNVNGIVKQVKDFDLVLRTRQDGDGNANGEMGYTSYNAATDTYTWVLTGRQSYTYHLKENNYTIQKSSEDDTVMPTSEGGVNEYHNVSEYRITNLPGQNTNGYVPYTEEDNEVPIEPIPSDLPAAAQPTIAFRNTYMREGMLTIKKVDNETDSGLPVQFRLTRGTVAGGFTADPVQPNLYRKHLNGSATYEYSNNYSGENETIEAERDFYTEKVANNIITTGPNGLAYVNLAPTTTDDGKKARTIYQLEEIVPEGYTGQQVYYVTIEADGSLSKVGYDPDKVVGSDGDSDKDSLDGSDYTAPPDIKTDDTTKAGWIEADTTNNIVTVKNSSRLLTEVIAEKQWAEDGVKEPVTVQLLRNGAPVPDELDEQNKVKVSYTQELNEANNWTFSWKKLPLYIDGELAHYSLREVKIGSALPDAAGQYADYLVTYDATLYAKYDQDADASSAAWSANAVWVNENNQKVYADHAKLVVHNRKTNGDIMFTKVDGNGYPLDGAEFSLYTDAACQTPAKITTTDENGAAVTKDATTTSKGGVVQFEKIPDGVYYMKETQTLQDYSSDGSVYRVEVSKGKVSITRVDGDAATEINQIVNSKHVDLELTKYAADEAGSYDQANPTPLPGAVFTLYQVENNTERVYRENLVTGTDGALSIEDLLAGSYVLRETAAPAGYRLIEEGLAFTVANSGEITLGVGDGDLPDGWVGFAPPTNIDVPIDGDDAVAHPVYRVEAVDKATWYFPTAGGVGIYVPMLAGTCLLCAAAWLVWRRAAARPSS